MEESIQQTSSFAPGYVTVVVTVLAVVITLLVRHFIKAGRCTSNATLHGKTAIVTGSNTGIGKETARDFAKRGARVILACRNLDKANEAVEDIRKQHPKADLVVMKLDLASFDSIRKFAKDVLATEHQIDILVNNAGLLSSKAKTKDGFEMNFGTNYLGTFLLTNLLLDKIKESAPARIITVSSVVHRMVSSINWDDLNFNQSSSYDPMKVYAHSKLANILFSKELARRLSGTRVTTYSLHPGIVYTQFDRHVEKDLSLLFKIAIYLSYPIFKTAEEGAQTTIYCAVDEDIQNKSGYYYSDCREVRTSSAARDAEAARKLWDVSLKLVGLENNSPEPVKEK